MTFRYIAWMAILFLAFGNTAYAVDTDGDGVVDSIDIDDDNDGVLDTYENLIDLSVFTLNGDATQISATEIRLTNAANNQFGTAMSQYTVDLSKSFSIDAEVYLGTKDANGADGMSFVLHNDSRGTNAVGNGEGSTLGSMANASTPGIANGLSFEFDTYKSVDGSDDPVEDHTQIRDTDVSFDDTAGAVTTVTKLPNLEDGNWHTFHLAWDADTSTLSYKIDGTDMQGITDTNIAANYFGGSNKVYFGFTAATGGLNNDQRIRNVTSTTLKDSDADGVPNHIDLDSDNDGIPDNIEAQSSDSYIAPGTFADANGNGLNDIYEAAQGGTDIVPVNTEGATVADYVNNDTDGDAISDCEEGLPDTTSNKACPVTTVQANGLVMWAGGNGYGDVNGNVDDPTADLQWGSHDAAYREFKLSVNNDYYTVQKDTALNGNVLANDTGKGMQVNTTPVTAPQNGTLTLNSDGTFTYTPNTGYVGTDFFEYSVTDTYGVSAVAKVYLSVEEPIVLDGTLIAEYRMDVCGFDGSTGDVIDNTVNRLYGTTRNGTLKSTGIICGSARFDGVDDDIVVPTDPKLDFDPNVGFTVSAWVYVTADTDGVYVSKMSGTGSFDDGWDLELYANTIYFDINGWDDWAEVANPSSDAWHQITGVYDPNNSGSQIMLYIDGSLADSTSYTTTFRNASSDDLTIGSGGTNGYQEYYQGDIDEVKIWDRPLTEQEVQDIYNNESAGRNWDNTDGTTTRVCRTCQCTAKPGSNLVSLQADFRTMTALGLPTDVNSILSPDFGSNYGASGDWYMAKRVYDVQPAPDGNNSASYQALSLSDNLEFGAAYWIRNTNASNSDVIYHANLKTVDFNATIADYPSCRSVNGKCVLIDLVSPNGTTNNGPYIYTMASFPVSKQIQWKEVRVLIDGVSYTPDQAEALGATFSATIWRYDQNGNSYTDVVPATPGVIDTIDPCYGYWVRLDQNASGKRVQLLVPEE